MFKNSILALTLATMTAPVATAALANDGAAQLAALLGVPAGAYSVAQMIQLEEARREGNASVEAFILGQGKDSVSHSSKSVDAVSSSGADQLARLAGVAPGEYSVNELIRLQDAIAENDRDTIAFILGGSDTGNTASDIGVVTPGKAQLAAGLGLDPAAYTTAELAEIYARTLD